MAQHSLTIGFNFEIDEAGTASNDQNEADEEG